jgi:hypothetical protein
MMNGFRRLVMLRPYVEIFWLYPALSPSRSQMRVINQVEDSGR